MKQRQEHGNKHLVSMQKSLQDGKLLKSFLMSPYYNKTATDIIVARLQAQEERMEVVGHK